MTILVVSASSLSFSPPIFVGYAIVVGDVSPLLDWPVQIRPVGQL